MEGETGMTGLEKITDRILAEARAQADEIRGQAEEEAGAVLREAEESLLRLREEAKEREALVKKELEARARSSASLKKRQLILAAKQDMIREQLEKAHQSLLEMRAEEYFSFIEQMVRQSALPKEGEIRFSERDLKRLPDGFDKRLNQAAAERGGSLKIGSEPAHVDGGFLLDYGGIEENCSFQALLTARRDECSDQIQKLLFETE